MKTITYTNPSLIWNNEEVTQLSNSQNLRSKNFNYRSDEYNQSSFSTKILTLCTLDSGGAGLGSIRRISA